jgi:hypothetical protein
MYWLLLPLQAKKKSMVESSGVPAEGSAEETEWGESQEDQQTSFGAVLVDDNANEDNIPR